MNKKENLGKYLRYSVTDVKSYRQWKWVSLRKRRPVYLYLYQFHLIFAYAIAFVGLRDDATDATSTFNDFPLILIAAHVLVLATCLLPNKYKSFLHDYRGERLCELTIMSAVLCSCSLLLPVTVRISENCAMANVVTLAFTTCMSLLYFHHLGLSVSTIFVTKIIFFMLWMIFMRVVQHNIFLIIVSLSSFFSFYSFGSLLEYELFIEYRKHEDYHRDQLQIHMRNVFAEDNLLLLKKVDKQLDAHLTYLQKQIFSVLTASTNFLLETKMNGTGTTNGNAIMIGGGTMMTTSTKDTKEGATASTATAVTTVMSSKEKLQMKEELFHVLTTTAAKLLETRFLRHALYYALLTSEESSESKFDRYMKFPFKKTCRRMFSMIETSVGHGLPYFVDANSSEILITAPKIIFEIIIFLLLYTTKYAGICYLTCENKNDNWEIKLQMTISALNDQHAVDDAEDEDYDDQEDEDYNDDDDEGDTGVGNAASANQHRRGEKGGHDILHGGEEEMDEYNRLLSSSGARRYKPQPRKHPQPSTTEGNTAHSNGSGGGRGNIAQGNQGSSFHSPFGGGKKQVEKTATDIIFATLKQEQQDCEDYGLVTTTADGVTEFTSKSALRRTTLERFSERITKHYLKTKITSYEETPEKFLKIITKKIPLSLEECTIEQTHHHTAPPPPQPAPPVPVPTNVSHDGAGSSSTHPPLNGSGDGSGEVALDSKEGSSASLTMPTSSAVNSGIVSPLASGQHALHATTTNAPMGTGGPGAVSTNPSTATNIPFFQDDMMIENDYAMKQQILIIIPRTQETQRIIEFKEKLQVLSIPNVVKSMSILHDYPYQHFIGVVLDTHLPKMTEQEISSLSKIVNSFIMISMSDIRDPIQMSQQFHLNIIACIRSRDSTFEIMGTIKEACKKTMIQYSFLEEFETLDELQSTLQQLKSNPNAPGTAGAVNATSAGYGSSVPKGGKDPSASSGSGKFGKRPPRDGSNPNIAMNGGGGMIPPLVSTTSASAFMMSSKTQHHYQIYTQHFTELLEEFNGILTPRVSDQQQHGITLDTLQQSFRKHQENLADATMMTSIAAATTATSTTSHLTSDHTDNSKMTSGFSFHALSNTFKNTNKQYAISKTWHQHPQKMKMHLVISYFMVYITALRDAYQNQNLLLMITLLTKMMDIATAWKLTRLQIWFGIYQDCLKVVMTIFSTSPTTTTIPVPLPFLDIPVETGSTDGGNNIVHLPISDASISVTSDKSSLVYEKAPEEIIHQLRIHPAIASYTLPIHAQKDVDRVLQELLDAMEVVVWDTAMER